MTFSVRQHTFSNGLVLLAEPMEHVRSATFNFLVPAGCARDPQANPGLANVASTMITRGAGARDSRALMLALDNLGVDSREGVGVHHMRFWATTLGRSLPAALDIYSDILLRPHLSEADLKPAQDLALQDLAGLEDEHSSRLMVELGRHLYPTPLSNDSRGTVEGIESLTPALVKQFRQEHFRPAGTIMAVAGKIEWESLRDQVGRLFGDWKGEAHPPLTYGPEPGRYAYLPRELEQTHLAVAYPSVSRTHPDYYLAQGAAQILSGGMGARLFTEIREKEGLCYTVHASYSPLKDRGAVIAYAASLNHQAQRTLDKLVSELERMKEGVTEEEVARVRVGLKTSLIMQQESTASRAAALASDFYNLGRVRSFDEIQVAIEGLTPAGITGHVHRFPPGDYRIVTLGPTELTRPV